MLDQTFSSKNLQRMFRKSDAVRYEVNFKDDEHVNLALELSKKIANANFDFQAFEKSYVTPKGVLAASTVEDDLVLRWIDRNLRKLYKIKQADRTGIIAQVAALLREDVPFTVIKLDIKDFYGSVDRDVLLGRKLINRIPLSVLM